MSVAGVFLKHDYFLKRPILCHAIGSICLISCVCSLWSIGAISLNRYVRICKSNSYNKLFSWRLTYFYTFCIWFFALMLDVPNFADWGDHTYDMKTLACSYDRLASYSYTVFFIMMFVSLPLLTVLFCNVNIFLIVLRSKRRVRLRDPSIKDGKTITMFFNETTQNQESSR